MTAHLLVGLCESETSELKKGLVYLDAVTAMQSLLQQDLAGIALIRERINALTHGLPLRSDADYVQAQIRIEIMERLEAIEQDLGVISHKLENQVEEL